MPEEPEPVTAISLTKYIENPITVVPTKHVWPLRVVATANPDHGMPSAVFVFQKDASGYLNDKWSHVASVQDLDTLPDSPDGVASSDDGSTLVPFYRQDTVTINCSSESHREEVWNIIYNDVVALVKNYKYSQDLQPEETYDITFVPSS